MRTGRTEASIRLEIIKEPVVKYGHDYCHYRINEYDDYCNGLTGVLQMLCNFDTEDDRNAYKNELFFIFINFAMIVVLCKE